MAVCVTGAPNVAGLGEGVSVTPARAKPASTAKKVTITKNCESAVNARVSKVKFYQRRVGPFVTLKMR